MPLSNRLCNPTPEAIKINWHKGVVIRVAPGSHTDLTVEQMDDFRPGKPGSEEVQTLMRYHGVFLLDSDKDYDVQALASLNDARKSKESQYKESMASIRRERAAQGVNEDDATFAEVTRQLGLDKLKNRVDKLQEWIKYYGKVVESKKATLSQTSQLDPEKTLFLTDGPPREFPSVAAKALFKLEYPELVSGDPAETTKETPSEESQPAREASFSPAN